MIIVRLAGGLGNQLFQYACARHLATINGTELKLDTISWFENIDELSKRNYLLGGFSIQVQKASIRELARAQNKSILQLYLPGLRWTVLEEKEFNLFQEDLFEKHSKNIYLSGFWQNENYFKPVSSLLKKEFVIKRTFNDDYRDIIEKSDSVAVHIRRGDYLKDEVYKKRYNDLTATSYYEKAVGYMKHKLKKPVFFVFSDEIDWCREHVHIEDSEVYFIERTESSLHDFSLMSKCRHQIIANSTFSWWAAWLNANPDKIVVCPGKWFLNQWRDCHYALPGWVKM